MTQIPSLFAQQTCEADLRSDEPPYRDRFLMLLRH